MIQFKQLNNFMLKETSYFLINYFYKKNKVNANFLMQRNAITDFDKSYLLEKTR